MFLDVTKTNDVRVESTCLNSYGILWKKKLCKLEEVVAFES